MIYEKIAIHWFVHWERYIVLCNQYANEWPFRWGMRPNHPATSKLWPLTPLCCCAFSAWKNKTLGFAWCVFQGHAMYWWKTCDKLCVLEMTCSCQEQPPKPLQQEIMFGISANYWIHLVKFQANATGHSHTICSLVETWHNRSTLSSFTKMGRPLCSPCMA